MSIQLTSSKNRRLILEEFCYNGHTNTAVYRNLRYQNYHDDYVCLSKTKRVTDSPKAMKVDSSSELSNDSLQFDNRSTNVMETESAIRPIKKPDSKLSKISISVDNSNLQRRIELIKKELQASMLQQEEAMRVIMRSLEELNVPTYALKITPFVGTTGVGKTFTLNIIKKHYPSHLIHEVMGKDFDCADNFRDISSSCCNLIFVDNLRAADLPDVVAFIRKLPTSQNLLVIPVINVHDTTDGLTYVVGKDNFRAVREQFDELGVNFEIALFDELRREVVEDWLKDELRRKSISEDRHDLLVKSLLDDDHVKYKGFKGLNSKLLTDLVGQ